jgi:hypothetical protein
MEMGIPALERPLFFEGQRLTPADLAALQAFDRELRWLHNRSLHGWGVVQGLAVGGERGAQAISIGAGYALDCLGRELVLARTVERTLPPVAAPSTYLVTLSYAEDAALVPRTRAGVCGAGGAVRLPDEPVVRFQDVAATGEGARRPGLDVVLAAVDVAGCRLARSPSTGERDDLRGEQPYVAAGRTPRHGTPWHLWPDEQSPLGVATTVETSVAGFRATPSYQAHVAGEREDPDGKWVVDGYPHVAAAGPTSFELRVALPDGFTAGRAGTVPLNPAGVLDAVHLGRLEHELGWHVVWMGVEG